MAKTVKVFVSYARSDRAWKEKLLDQLAILQRTRVLEIWHDKEITPGQEWDPLVKQKLEESDIILFLVSPNFMRSDYSWGVEVRRALERHEAKDAVVIPIILRPVHFEAAPFAKLQALPTDAKPVTTWKNTGSALADVAKNIDLAAKRIRAHQVNNRSDIPKRTQNIRPGHPLNDPVSGMTFTWIPAGAFTMGWNVSPHPSFWGSLLSTTDQACAQPIHRVKITRGFWMANGPVTQKVWKSIYGSNPSYFVGDDRPVDSVSWLEAQQFIKELNERNTEYSYRLPTEAEWEYAARAGTTDPLLGKKPYEIAWYAKNSENQTHPVGQKSPNPWGLYDVLGNVWEWCSDWYDVDHNYYAISPEVDPKGPSTGTFRVSRGGAWYIIESRLHVAVRQWHPPSHKDKIIGFRCLMESKRA